MWLENVPYMREGKFYEWNWGKVKDGDGETFLNPGIPKRRERF